MERQFVRPVHVGDTILPSAELEPRLGIISWDGHRLLARSDDRLDLYPGLAAWWRNAETQWETHRTSQMTLLDQIDYRRKLQTPFPTGPHRVVWLND